MYMIKRVTNVRYLKDVVHEPFRHLRDRAKKAPKARKYVGSSSAAPHHDDVPAAPSPPRPRRRHRGSMIKRVLKSIFSMCKTIATETNENHWDIIEIKSHLGLPTDPYCELPTYDDPFAEWDARRRRARGGGGGGGGQRKRRRGGGRRLRVIQLLHTSFLVLDAKGGVKHLSIYHVWNFELLCVWIWYNGL
jgi:hypothetical protein